MAATLEEYLCVCMHTEGGKKRVEVEVLRVASTNTANGRRSVSAVTTFFSIPSLYNAS